VHEVEGTSKGLAYKAKSGRERKRKRKSMDKVE
jgi:hypothetical protein